MTPFRRLLILRYGLTAKEAEACDHTAQGLTTNIAAKRIGIAQKTLKWRLNLAYKKLPGKGQWLREKLAKGPLGN